jgi:hypothetical protein
MASVGDLKSLLIQFRTAHDRQDGVAAGHDVRPLIPFGEAAVTHADFDRFSPEDRAEILTILGVYRRQVGKEEGSLPAFDAAIAAFAAALELLRDGGDSGRNYQKGWVLVEEVEARVERFAVSGDQNDLKTAGQRAVNALPLLDGLFKTPDGRLTAGPMLWDGGDPGFDSLRCRNRMGRGHRLAFLRSGDSDHLDRAVFWLRSAVPDDRFDEYRLRDNACDLVSTYLERYRNYKNPTDLEAAAVLGRRLVNEVPDMGPRPGYRVALARALLLCYGRGGPGKELLEAFAQAEAVAWPPEPNAGADADARRDLAVLHTLGCVFGIDRSRPAPEESSLTDGAFPDYPQGERLPRLLLEAAGVLRQRATRADDPAALGHAVALLERVLVCPGVGPVLQVDTRRELASSLRARFLQDEQRATIDRAVGLAREAAAQATKGSRAAVESHLELARCLQRRIVGANPQGREII